MATDLHGAAAFLFGGNVCGAEECLSQVVVAEAAQTPVATEVGAEQTLFLGMQQVEATATTLMEFGWTAHTVELLARGAGRIDHGQGIEVALIGGTSDACGVHSSGGL